MENPKPALNKDDEKTNWSIKAQTIALKTGSTLSRGAEDASRKITDHSLYYADKVDEKFSQALTSIKQKPWAKKVMGWWGKKPSEHSMDQVVVNEGEPMRTVEGPEDELSQPILPKEEA